MFHVKQVFNLPWPPSANRSTRYFRGKVVQAQCSRDFERDVTSMVDSVRANLEPYKPTDRLEIEIILHPPSLAHYDIDNRIRAVFNSMEVAGVVTNDSQFDVLLVQRGPKIKGGKCVVKINKLG